MENTTQNDWIEQKMIKLKMTLKMEGHLFYASLIRISWSWTTGGPLSSFFKTLQCWRSHDLPRQGLAVPKEDTPPQGQSIVPGSEQFCLACDTTVSKAPGKSNGPLYCLSSKVCLKKQVYTLTTKLLIGFALKKELSYYNIKQIHQIWIAPLEWKQTSSLNLSTLCLIQAHVSGKAETRISP